MEAGQRFDGAVIGAWIACFLFDFSSQAIEDLDDGDSREAAPVSDNDGHSSRAEQSLAFGGVGRDKTHAPPADDLTDGADTAVSQDAGHVDRIGEMLCSGGGAHL